MKRNFTLFTITAFLIVCAGVQHNFPNDSGLARIVYALAGKAWATNVESTSRKRIVVARKAANTLGLISHHIKGNNYKLEEFHIPWKKLRNNRLKVYESNVAYQ